MPRVSRSPAVGEVTASQREDAAVAELEEENASSRDALAQIKELVARASAPAPATPHQRLALWYSRLPSPAPEMLHMLAGRGERYTTPQEWRSAWA